MGKGAGGCKERSSLSLEESISGTSNNDSFKEADLDLSVLDIVADQDIEDSQDSSRVDNQVVEDIQEASRVDNQEIEDGQEIEDVLTIDLDLDDFNNDILIEEPVIEQTALEKYLNDSTFPEYDVLADDIGYRIVSGAYYFGAKQHTFAQLKIDTGKDKAYIINLYIIDKLDENGNPTGEFVLSPQGSYGINTEELYHSRNMNISRLPKKIAEKYNQGFIEVQKLVDDDHFKTVVKEANETAQRRTMNRKVQGYINHLFYNKELDFDKDPNNYLTATYNEFKELFGDGFKEIIAYELKNTCEKSIENSNRTLLKNKEYIDSYPANSYAASQYIHFNERITESLIETKNYLDNLNKKYSF